MEKVILINDKKVKLKSTCGFLLHYLRQFDMDALTDMFKLYEDIRSLNDEIDTKIILKLFWALAKEADSNLEPPEIWLNNFENIDIVDLAAEIFEMFSGCFKKNDDEIESADDVKERNLTTYLLIASAVDKNLTLKDLSSFTLNMFIEFTKEYMKFMGNSEEREAEQSDFDSF